MKQLWRIISEFDVEGVILVMGVLTLLYGLLVMQADPAAPIFDLIQPWIVGVVITVASGLILLGLALGRRWIVLTSIPFGFFCWCLLLASTLARLGVRSTPLVAATLLLIALASAWTWIRILVDPGRIDRQRRLWRR